MSEFFTEADHAKAERHPTLGAEYSAADRVAERFLAHWKDEHAERLCEEIMKPVMDAVQERVWDAFRDYLLQDAELNIATCMRHMVEESVRALIGGRTWANVKYIKTGAYRSEEVRATLAKMYADEIKDGRIADLEAEVARLTKSLEYRSRY
jgi:hypothetical protein